MEDYIQSRRREFGGLLETVKYPKAGVYRIEVAEVLGVGEYHLGVPEVAVIKDTQGRIWALPEGDSLVSRWDVKKGMKLKVKVILEDGEKDIKEVFVLRD